MGMYKFGGYRGENVLLCSSVVEVKEKLFRLLFGKALRCLYHFKIVVEVGAPMGG